MQTDFDLIPTDMTTTDINRASLAQLSVSATELWDEIENCPADIDLEKLLEQQLNVQNATETKVDAIAWVADQMKLDLETWEERLKRVTALYSTIIQRRQNQLKQLKTYLLQLHKAEILPEQLVGMERRINFQDSGGRVILLVDPSDSKFPEKFKKVEIAPKKSEILAAKRAGEDISGFAQVITDKQVRFGYLSSKSRK